MPPSTSVAQTQLTCHARWAPQELRLHSLEPGLTLWLRVSMLNRGFAETSAAVTPPLNQLRRPKYVRLHLRMQAPVLKPYKKEAANPVTSYWVIPCICRTRNQMGVDHQPGSPVLSCLILFQGQERAAMASQLWPVLGWAIERWPRGDRGGTVGQIRAVIPGYWLCQRVRGWSISRLMQLWGNTHRLLP